MKKEERISIFFLTNQARFLRGFSIYPYGSSWKACFWQTVFPFHFCFPEIFGRIKKNHLSIAKNNDEATVNMDQQNPLENKESPNIYRGKSRFLMYIQSL